MNLLILKILVMFKLLKEPKLEKALAKIEFKKPSKLIFVMGQTGKTSMTVILTKLFKNSNYNVINNLDNDINLLILKNSHLNGRLKGDVWIIKTDKELFKMKPDYILIDDGNLKLNYGHIIANENLDIVAKKVTTYSLNDISVDKKNIIIDDLKININFYPNHILAIFTLANIAKIKKDIIKDTFTHLPINEQIKEIKNKKIIFSNENRASFINALSFVKNKKIVLFFINNISFLYDIDTFNLKRKEIYLFGPLKYDLAVWLKINNLNNFTILDTISLKEEFSIITNKKDIEEVL